MNTLVLTGAREFPLTTDALAFMQAAYGMLENFSQFAGDNYILSGCVVTGSSASSGMVVIKGRLMPFAGGSIQENVKVVTNVTPVTVGGGTREQTSYAAEFGTSTNPADNVAWATLVANRIATMLEMKAGIAALSNGLTTITENLTAGLNNKQVQLDVLNRAIVSFAGYISSGGGITSFLTQPGFVVEVVKVTTGAPIYTKITHNIGHQRYSMMVVSEDNYNVLHVVQDNNEGRVYARRRTDDLPVFADFYVTIIVYP